MMDGIYTTNLSADKQKFVHDHHTSAQKTYDLAGAFAPTIVVVQDNTAYPFGLQDGAGGGRRGGVPYP